MLYEQSSSQMESLTVNGAELQILAPWSVGLRHSVLNCAMETGAILILNEG